MEEVLGDGELEVEGRRSGTPPPAGGAPPAASAREVEPVDLAPSPAPAAPASPGCGTASTCRRRSAPGSRRSPPPRPRSRPRPAPCGCGRRTRVRGRRRQHPTRRGTVPGSAADRFRPAKPAPCCSSIGARSASRSVSWRIWSAPEDRGGCPDLHPRAQSRRPRREESGRRSVTRGRRRHSVADSAPPGEAAAKLLHVQPFMSALVRQVIGGRHLTSRVAAFRRRIGRPQHQLLPPKRTPHQGLSGSAETRIGGASREQLQQRWRQGRILKKTNEGRRCRPNQAPCPAGWRGSKEPHKPERVQCA